MKKLKASVPVMACRCAKRLGNFLKLLSRVLQSNWRVVFRTEGGRAKGRGGE